MKSVVGWIRFAGFALTTAVATGCSLLPGSTGGNMQSIASPVTIPVVRPCLQGWATGADGNSMKVPWNYSNGVCSGDQRVCAFEAAVQDVLLQNGAEVPEQLVYTEGADGSWRFGFEVFSLNNGDPNVVTNVFNELAKLNATSEAPVSPLLADACVQQVVGSPLGPGNAIQTWVSACAACAKP
jgi:hypothetical protein